MRLQDELLARVDAERKRAGVTRASAIAEALRLWVERRQYDAAVHRDQKAYADHPVTGDEFTSVLGAQKWPK